ncbi:DUF4347 domain-containing protein [Pseudoroseomonas globiformis]|uniref:DUF4347 domain-containing protein n=1 Tax=Teichococcus globiformis TaxID=2307229 RepID=A0ABV7FZS1_9PROT
MRPAVHKPDQILVLDPRLTGWPSYLISAGPDAAVLILDVHRDGLVQIAEVAESYMPVAGLVLIGHGSAGFLVLGQTILEATSLAPQAAQMQRLAQSLAPDARIQMRGLPGIGAPGRYLAHSLSGYFGRIVLTDQMAPRPRLASTCDAAATPRAKISTEKTKACKLSVLDGGKVSAYASTASTSI